MIKIISTTGHEILFNLSGSRKLTITPTVAVKVSEEELVILQNRLGHQIKVTDSDVEPAKKTKTEQALGKPDAAKQEVDESSKIDNTSTEETKTEETAKDADTTDEQVS